MYSEYSDSEREPFSSGSSDNYEPENTSDYSSSDENQGTAAVQRRSQITTSKRQKKGTQKCGKEMYEKENSHPVKSIYINSVNKAVAPRAIGEGCRCRKKCFLKIDLENRQRILQKFNKLGEHSVQNHYLAGLITSTPPVRLRPRTGTRTAKSASNKYRIRLGQEVFDVCKKAFCAVHGVSSKRVETIAANLAKPSTITSAVDMRGRHSNRPNAISAEIVESIHKHITEFPKRKSHYSRSKNNGQYYLSSELNIRTLYTLYLSKFEPNMYKLIQENRDRLPDFKPTVTYDFYYRYFKAHFSNYHFGHPRSDTCQLCDTLENKKKSVRTDDELNEIETQHTLHQMKAKTFFDDLSQKTSIALEDPRVDTLCFDFQQNAPLPKVPSGDAFYLRQLWMYNFCIHSAKMKKSTYYVYDEVTGRKTPNETISFLAHYIDNTLDKTVKVLYLFSDICAAQNKNHSLMQYLYCLVQHGRFDKIVHRFPEPGHSFLPCDRSFGRTEKYTRKVERIYTPEEHIQQLQKSSKSFHVVAVTQDMILNYANTLALSFKKVVMDKNKQKLAISKQIIFEYDSKSPDVKCSTSTGMIVFSEFDIRKKNQTVPFSLPTVEDRAYDSPFSLKKVKYDNVMTLVKKYVPESCKDYYRNLKCDVDQPGDETDITDTEEMGALDDE